MSLLQALLAEYARDRIELEADVAERLFVYALVWSVGGLLETADRVKLDHLLRAHAAIKVALPEAVAPEELWLSTSDGARSFRSEDPLSSAIEAATACANEGAAVVLLVRRGPAPPAPRAGTPHLQARRCASALSSLRP